METEIKNLREYLSTAVRNSKPDSAMFSGGIDSTSLVYFGLKNNPDLTAITVAFENGENDDLKYAKDHASALGIKNHLIAQIKQQEFTNLVEEVVLGLGCFNIYWVSAGVVLLKGLKTAKKNNLNKIMTGEGSDDIFGSFPVMVNWKFPQEELEEFIKTRIKDIDLMTNKMAKIADVNISLPFYENELMDFSLNLPRSMKIKKEADVIITKYILRKAMESLLPSAITNRPQTMAFNGVSTLVYLEKNYSNNNLNLPNLRKEYNINFKNSTEFSLFKILLDSGQLASQSDAGNKCLHCHYPLRDKGSVHCRICGTLQYNNVILPF